MGCDRVPTQRCSLAYCYIAGLILLSGCVTTSTTPEMAWVRTDGRKIADDPALLQQGRAMLLLATPISTTDRQLHQRADAWPRRDTSLCAGIRQRTCARHTLQLPNAVLPTDNDHSGRSVIAGATRSSSDGLDRTSA